MWGETCTHSYANDDVSNLSVRIGHELMGEHDRMVLPAEETGREASMCARQPGKLARLTRISGLAEEGCPSNSNWEP